MSERIVVAMTGGVDSSVAAALLVEQGTTSSASRCGCWESAGRPAAARSTTSSTRAASPSSSAFRFYVMDFRGRVRARGGGRLRRRVPSPAARRTRARAATSTSSSALLWQRARELGATMLATGHYARIGADRDGRRAAARRRRRRRTSRTSSSRSTRRSWRARCFPVGGLTQERGARARRQRAACRWRTSRTARRCASRRAATSAAFVGRRIAPRVPLRPGAIVDEQGTVLAAHAGIHRFTVGQRRGLGVAAAARRAT